MALQYLKNPYFSLNAVDLSAFVRSVGIPTEVAELDSTAGNSAGATSAITGLMSWTIEIECNNDYAAAQVDATVWAALIAGAAVAIEIRPTTLAVGVANPKWTGNVIVTGYDPFGGAKVGDLIVVKPTLKGTGALTRATA